MGLLEEVMDKAKFHEGADYDYAWSNDDGFYVNFAEDKKGYRKKMLLLLDAIVDMRQDFGSHKEDYFGIPGEEAVISQRQICRMRLGNHRPFVLSVRPTGTYVFWNDGQTDSTNHLYYQYYMTYGETVDWYYVSPTGFITSDVDFVRAYMSQKADVVLVEESDNGCIVMNASDTLRPYIVTDKFEKFDDRWGKVLYRTHDVQLAKAFVSRKAVAI